MDKKCKKCNQIKSLIEFVKNKNCKDGYEGTCKSCKNIARTERYQKHYKNKNPLIEGEKECNRCKERKSVDEFNIDLKCVDGRRNVCKLCDNKRIKERRSSNKKELNQSFWNRYTDSINWRADSKNIVAEELSSLYDNQSGKCIYCHVNMDKNFHVDHKIPLSKGGKHDILNIAFTCADCNRLKHTKTHLEFLTFLKSYTQRFK